MATDSIKESNLVVSTVVSTLNSNDQTKSVEDPNDKTSDHEVSSGQDDPNLDRFTDEKKEDDSEANNVFDEDHVSEERCKSVMNFEDIMMKEGNATAKKCYEEFDLKAFPTQWAQNKHLVKNSFVGDNVKDEEIWKRYHRSRTGLEDTVRALEESSSSHLSKKNAQDNADSDSDFDDDDFDAPEKARLKHKLLKSLKLLTKKSPIMSLLEKHTIQRVAGVKFDKEDPTKLESATVVSTIFSPYMLPRAVQFCHRYHHRPSSSSRPEGGERNEEGIDFKCTWQMHFVSLEEIDTSNDDDESTYDNIWKPVLEDLEELCSNCYVPTPTDEVNGFFPVEDTIAHNLTPSTVRRIRQWLFGTALSYEVIDDFSLLQYVFVSCGTSHKFCTQYGTIGYNWKPPSDMVDDMIAYDGMNDDELQETRLDGVNWLEHHVRLVSGGLRAVDRFYVPYDQRVVKGEWGLAALETRYETNGVFEEDEALHKNPWLVWDRSAHGNHGDTSVAATVYGLITGL